ncbi:DNA-binding response regulator [Ktedonobacteria bacterium brp13]|nr:DNA-binding response regulator [Ktedonobacteria bacterium brp13]
MIAEPRDILRTGMRTILAADERVATLCEASNAEELQMHLRNSSIDLIIVNEILTSDITILPPNRFVLLTAEFNITTLLMAYKHGAKGYLLETPPAELLRAVLGLPERAFLVEPRLTTNIMRYLVDDTRLMVKEELLTPREREIVDLLREGVDRQRIASQLHISSATLKTHIKNIFRKRINITV